MADTPGFGHRCMIQGLRLAADVAQWGGWAWTPVSVFRDKKFHVLPLFKSNGEREGTIKLIIFMHASPKNLGYAINFRYQFTATLVREAVGNKFVSQWALKSFFSCYCSHVIPGLKMIFIHKLCSGPGSQVFNWESKCSQYYSSFIMDNKKILETRVVIRI
jgi:hypothetical protein